MIVDVTKLNSGLQEGYDYSEDAEYALCSLVYGEENIKKITNGYNADYDVLLTNGKKVEVKFTNSHNLFIEESYYNDTPSGLSITEADVYLIVQKGTYRNGQEMGKIKEIPVQTLKNVKHLCRIESYEPYKYSTGSKGFILDKELGQNDGWIGNIAYIHTVNGYDLSRFTYKR